MSLLPPEVHTALSQLLRALSTPDNAVRSQAEDQLNNDWVQNRPDVLLMGLAEQLGGATDTIVSQSRPQGCFWLKWSGEDAATCHPRTYANMNLFFD